MATSVSAVMRPAMKSGSSGRGMWGLTTWTTIGSVEPWTASPARRRSLIDEISASSANRAPLALSSIMWTYCSIAPRPQRGVFPMHQATHSSVQPRCTASRRLASLIHTASVQVVPPASTAGRNTGSETPAVSRGRSISSWGTATQVLVVKSATLKVPVMPVDRRMASRSIPRCGNTCSTSPSASPKAGRFVGEPR